MSPGRCLMRGSETANNDPSSCPAPVWGGGTSPGCYVLPWGMWWAPWLLLPLTQVIRDESGFKWEQTTLQTTRRKTLLHLVWNGLPQIHYKCGRWIEKCGGLFVILTKYSNCIHAVQLLKNVTIKQTMLWTKKYIIFPLLCWSIMLGAVNYNRNDSIFFFFF